MNHRGGAMHAGRSASYCAHHAALPEAHRQAADAGEPADCVEDPRGRDCAAARAASGCDDPE
eukprot:2776029-Pyramimonas_sp.AAC.1